MDVYLSLPGGQTLFGSDPVVIIGPNGSGKTRQSRMITAPTSIEFINALRNTRVAPELPAMSTESARSNYESQKGASRGNHWEIASEFDYMLAQLLGQYSAAAIRFSKSVQRDATLAEAGPEVTPLLRVEQLWSKVFPGRSLNWENWKPEVVSTTSGAVTTYSGNLMSDGEKAALYLAGRVMSAAPGVIVVDEPETHFHSLLAVRLWSALEAERRDIRFIYITHDLTFALSRRNATYVLASPTDGFRPVSLDEELPEGVATALLGTASLSFYASRVAFCEGDEGSYDARLLNAWFNGLDTVVKPVGGRQAVLRCVEALKTSGIARSLSAVGITDRDYYSDAFNDALPSEVTLLPVHEIESVFAMSGVVAAVCAHQKRAYSPTAYAAALQATVSADQQSQVVAQRWKASVEPRLVSIVAGASSRRIPDLSAAIPAMMNPSSWGFDPALILAEEEARVKAAHASAVDDFLAIFPGKQMLPVAAATAGMGTESYVNLIIETLRLGAVDDALHQALETALSSHLPARAVSTQGGPTPLTPPAA